VVVTEAYLSAAEYKGAECKYNEVYGIDTNLNLGGGAQSFTFRRSAQASLLLVDGVRLNGARVDQGMTACTSTWL
jgi:outer membrane cobalamin receptor